MTKHEIPAGGWLDMATGEGVSDGESASFDSALAGLSVDDVDPSDWDIWIKGLRRRETVYRSARLRLEALRAGEVLPVCAQCGETIAGRSDARYCSTRCRVAAHRAKPKAVREAEDQAYAAELNQAMAAKPKRR